MSNEWRLRSVQRLSKHSVAVYRLIVLVCLCAFTGQVQARTLTLTPYFETVLVSGVGSAWTTVALDNTYANAIPVCTPVLETFAGSAGNYVDPPSVVRIQNITATSFQVRVQDWEDSPPASTRDVHCIVMDEGAHTLPDGRLVEAHSVLSDQTSGQFSTDGAWNLALLEDVTSSIVHNYTNPVVLGQVISYNDNRASTVFLNNCSSRTREPFFLGPSDRICVGKQIGQIVDVRNPETLGYIVAEAGSGSVNNVNYELALGPDTVGGNSGANVGFSYSVSNDYDIAVLTQARMDGGNGSYAVLYGADPLPANFIVSAVDEDDFVDDMTRNHTREPVYYWAFSGATITLKKDLINDDGGTATLSDFALTASGPIAFTGVSGTDDVTDVIVVPGVYELSEVSAPGYVASNWVCTGVSVFDGNKIKIDSEEDAVCTITNDDIGIDIDLSIKKSVSNSSPNIGDTLSFTLDVTNVGQDAATNFQVFDPIPAGFSYVAGSMAGGDVRDESTPTGTGLNWTINSLAPSALTSLTFQATVLAP